MSVWPFPHNGQRLQLVLRQWAYHPGEGEGERLADQLVRNADWNSEIIRLRKYWTRRDDPDPWWRQRAPWLMSDTLGWIRNLVESDTLAPWRDCVEAEPDADWVLAWRLRQSGLPDNPSVVAHLRAVAADKADPPLPRRGVLVTTYVYAQQPMIEYSPYAPQTEVSFALDHLEAHSLMDEASRIAKEHRNWIHDQAPRHPISTVSDKRRSQGKSFAVEPRRGRRAIKDYKASALDRVTLKKLRESAAGQSRDAWACTISKHINLTDDRVTRARKRDGDDRQPREEWAPDVRQVLWTLYNKVHKDGMQTP
jgi:hypothetical protein